MKLDELTLVAVIREEIVTVLNKEQFDSLEHSYLIHVLLCMAEMGFSDEKCLSEQMGVPESLVRIYTDLCSERTVNRKPYFTLELDDGANPRGFLYNICLQLGLYRLSKQ